MRTVYSYSIEPSLGLQMVTSKVGAVPIRVTMNKVQGFKVWAIVDTDAAAGPLRIFVIRTGKEVPPTAEWFQTISVAGNSYHIFREPTT